MIGIPSLSTFIMAKDQVTIRFMGWEASLLEIESVKNGLVKFMELNPDIKVEYIPAPGDYYAKLFTMIAGRAAPDVFFLKQRYI